MREITTRKEGLHGHLGKIVRFWFNRHMILYLATNTGLLVAEWAGGRLQATHRALDGVNVTCVAAQGDSVLAGTTEGMFSSTDRGDHWVEPRVGPAHRHIRWLAYHPTTTGLAFAGTEPAALFVSVDDGTTWRECPEVTDLRRRFGWWLPYSPEAGCVRGFAFHGNRAYAAVEVGGALRSDDRGATWALAEGSDGRPRFGAVATGHVHPDVHSVEVHPSSPDLVFAPTGGGFYRSADGGRTWDALYQDCYVRAVWVDPDDVKRIVLGPSEGPDGRDGRIELSTDGGATWNRIYGPWNRDMVERFTPAGEALFAITAEGRLLYARTDTLEWSEVHVDSGDVNSVAVA